MAETETAKIRVIIADDHPAFREGLSRCLQDEEDLEVVAEAADGEEAVARARELQPDVVIVDVSMPKINGIEAAKLIKQDCPNTSILMISAFDYQSYVLSSLRAGSAGYMLKTSPLSEIVSAIRLVRAGGTVFDVKVAGKLLSRLSNSSHEKPEFGDLHSRELEILRLAARGMSNKEMGGQLAISERTVQTHLVNVYKKLRVSSRTEAVLYALKEGWITPDDLPAKR
ncbi:MAG: response regulator transcription factor [Chloroflexi bacterium]|nr:response regulator transcription factor [Chloroflexota bacterium]